MNNGYPGMSYERYIQRNDDSKAHKLQSAYWTTKQVVLKKLGKKEDEHIIASDSQLDAKLELFKSVQKTCNDLSMLTDRYMECICVLSQCENEFGRFLKKQSNIDKTRAGDMMNVTGRSLGHSSQQRLLLRSPLERFFQEIETFRQRAVADTHQTIKIMENKRNDYRGSLMWMKKVSEELDPDTFKQLEKFRKVQAQVKKSKDNFDKLKVDSMQKIDLLSASRCNMLSHALVGYQNALINFWDKTAKTMSVISESFKGYQYYEFSMLKELNVETRKLADDNTGDSRDTTDYGSDDLIGQFSDILKTDDDDEGEDEDRGGFDYYPSLGIQSEFEATPKEKPSNREQIGNQDGWIIDLLSNDTVSKEDKEFFSDMFDFNEHSANPLGTNRMKQTLDGPNKDDPFDIFGGIEDKTNSEFDDFQGASGTASAANSYLPSQLWSQSSNVGNIPQTSQKHSSNDRAQNDNKKLSSTYESWMNLFSELDPNSNPDKLSEKPDKIAEV